MLTRSQQRYAALAFLAMSGAVTGCVYDAGQRCGPAMVYNETAELCVCESNAIAVTGGCRRCAEDEVVTAGACGCAAGHAKNADNLCVAVAGLGSPCDTASAPCTDATYSYCAVRGGGTAGTCTKSCVTSNDCDTSYTCTTWEAHPSCRRFDGAGQSCTGAADCMGDARYCDTFMTHVCIVQGCSLAMNDCPRGTMCCDFSRFGAGTLCTGACL